MTALPEGQSASIGVVMPLQDGECQDASVLNAMMMAVHDWHAPVRLEPRDISDVLSGSIKTSSWKGQIVFGETQDVEAHLKKQPTLPTLCLLKRDLLAESLLQRETPVLYLEDTWDDRWRALLDYEHDQAAGQSRRYAVLAPDTAHGRQCAVLIVDGLRQKGHTCALCLFYQQPYQTVPWKKLGTTPLDGWIILESGQVFEELMKFINSWRPTGTHILSLGLWSFKQAKAVHWPHVFFALPHAQSQDVWEKRYQELYGHLPSEKGFDAYEAMTLMVWWLHQNDWSLLSRSSGFRTIKAPVRFVRAQSQRLMSVFESSEQGPVLRASAPDGFESRT